ncbi:MAG: ATP-binding protein [Gemmatimonadota bacterium]|nr:ATP-binding protein [Gemmatimonadota bacterium]
MVSPLDPQTWQRSLTAMDERRLLTGVYVARLSIANALAIAATFVRTTRGVETSLLPLAALVVGIPLGFTLLSLLYTRYRPIDSGFLGAQVVHDLLLTTAAVFFTGGIGSEFAFIYILLIVAAGFLLGFAGAILTTVGSVISYLGVAWYQISPQLPAPDGIVELPNLSGPPSAILWSLALTAVVFCIVGLLGGMVVRRLRSQRSRLDELERQLAEARIDAQDILNTVESGILSVNADEELDFVNYTARAQLGISGTPRTRELRRETGASRLLDLLLETLRTEREFEFVEVMLPGDGGQPRPFSVATTVLYDPGGAKRGAAAILKDVEHVKRLEELARQADRLRAVTELAAGLAHEIQNPLAAIRSSVELLEAEEDEWVDEEQERRLRRLIVREADRLAELIGDFMAFSRMSLKTKERVNLVEVVEDALEVERVASKRGEVRFMFTSPGREYYVEGDHNLLKQVCLNLLSNAVSAVEDRPDGRVQIRVGGNPQLPGLEKAPGPYVALEVRDNGPGIEPEDRERIFDPFFTTRDTGFGMGLAIVNRIVDLHGGMVWVETEPGEGSVFRIALPRAR